MERYFEFRHGSATAFEGFATHAPKPKGLARRLSDNRLVGIWKRAAGPGAR